MYETMKIVPTVESRTRPVDYGRKLKAIPNMPDMHMEMKYSHPSRKEKPAVFFFLGR
jgi:hypothetical protein